MRALLAPEITHAIRATTWRALFAARGYPPSITPSTTDLDAIATALRTRDLPLPLARALFTIAAFACEPGRADIYAAAEALAFPDRWPAATSPADLIAHLLALSISTPAIAELLEAAQILRDRSFRPRTTHVYVGLAATDAPVGEPTQHAPAFQSAFAAWSARFGFGAVTEVPAWSAPHELHWEIVHEDRAQTFVTIAKRKSVRTTHRALRSHHLVYEASARRLSVTTDCAEAVTPLAAIAGAVLFANERHFLDERAIDLWKLQDLGPAALDVRALDAKITATAVGGTWHSGKNHAITPRGRDFFEALARYKIRIEGGRLDQVTLRAKVPSPNGAPAQCDVALRPPHGLTVSEPEHAPLVHELLDAAKITSPEPRPRDFFAHQPWIDTREGWIASEGDGFASLVKDGLLNADKANRSVAPPGHPYAGRTATAYPLRGKKFLAWSPDPTILPFVVDEASLVVYALSFAKLARAIADALGLEAPATALDDDGVLACGRRALGPTHVLVFLLTRPIRPATVERLREAAEHGHAILVAPDGRMQEHGLRQLAMPKLAGPWRPLLGATVRALHLESFVDTTLYAPEGARVVLHRAKTRVWIDALLCVALTEIHFRLLEILLKHAGQLVHTKDIAEHVARGKQTEDTTRRAVDSCLAAIEKSFKAAKKKPPKDLRSLITQPRHGHYTLHASGFVD